MTGCGPVGLGAGELVARLAARELSAVEVMRAHLERIAAANPHVNAIVTLVDEDAALAAAAAADAALARGALPGPLHGLPVAVKDLEDTAGLRTTYGSPLHRDHVPERDGLLAERLRAAGAIIIGKTNTPEFGAGSQTFNPLFGATRNPYDLTRTAGGSSGGAAAAVATGMLPVADGSDFGGSLRNPAAFCNVVGLRPAPGRIPALAPADAWSPLPVHGPIARTVADAALLLEALAGPDPRAPLSLPAERFTSGLEEPDVRGLRIAWSRDLCGLPIEPAISAVLEPHRATFAALGCTVEAAEPALAGADEAFEVLRALGFARAFGPLLEAHGDELKETVRWNARVGLALTGPQVAAAVAGQSAAFHAMRELLEVHDALALPVTQVVPFDVAVEWPRAVAGVPMDSYLAWMRSCSRISLTAHPAISVPAGFTPEGLPVGLQLVGRHRGERDLLRLAAAFEAAAGAGARRPPPPA